MKQSEFKLLNYIRKYGLKDNYRTISENLDISIGNISTLIKSFISKNYINKQGLTKIGLDALKPYKVNNAVILAAGPSSRFVPLSLELPKGLFKVRGEVLIERQIKQLINAGIKNITVVLGYKKELFFYLKDKYDVDIIINQNFNVKNNIESIFLAKDKIDSTYICSCDDYFVSNPFDKYEYKSFYASVYLDNPTHEMYAITNKKDEITKLVKGLSEGNILLGHSYWDNDFSNKFLSLISEVRKSGEYDKDFWEKLLSDNISKMPAMAIKKYPDNSIFEFDSLEELRKFDDKYVNNTESKIMKNICCVLNCNENDITNLKPIYEGLTNTSFIFEVGEKKYVYRQPGDGTNKIINRKHEKEVLEFAKRHNFDSTYLYLDEDEGWKISHYVENYREPDYNSKEDSNIVIDILKKLHSTFDERIDWEFIPFDEALKIEKSIDPKILNEMNDFDDIKQNIKAIYETVKNDNVKKCICHCDTYKHNWMIKKDQTILIDWEYAGLSDPGVDVGYYIVDAKYDYKTAISLIKKYLGNEANDELIHHFLSYTAIIAYYWFVWALYKESLGNDMGESLYNWYLMAKYFSNKILSQNSIDNRCQFDLLVLCKQAKLLDNNIRDISNKLGYSWSNIINNLEISVKKGYLELNNNQFSVTEKALKALEKFRVRRAIILAAGFGSRMMPATANRPKPLIKVNGKRIIDSLLDALLENNITEIYIVRGYKKEKFDELLDKYPMIKFIDNDDYDTTNNISSLLKVINYLDNTYICEADFIVYNSEIISEYHYSSNYLGAKVKETDDWSFKQDLNGGFACNYKKGNTNCYQAYGISFWNKQDSKKLRNYLPKMFSSDNGHQKFWEMCVFEDYASSFKVEINECKKSDIIEIDSYKELCELDNSYIEKETICNNQ